MFHPKAYTSDTEKKGATQGSYNGYGTAQEDISRGKFIKIHHIYFRNHLRKGKRVSSEEPTNSAIFKFTCTFNH